MKEVKVLEINKKRTQGLLQVYVLEATALNKLSSFRRCSEMMVIRAMLRNIKSEVSTKKKFKIIFFSLFSNIFTNILNKLSVSILYHVEGSSRFIPNVRNRLRNSTVLQTSRLKPQNREQFKAHFSYVTHTVLIPRFTTPSDIKNRIQCNKMPITSHDNYHPSTCLDTGVPPSESWKEQSNIRVCILKF
jgi:hypothetical protein